MVVTANASGTAGTPHQFMCSIYVPTAVDTSVSANVTWFGPRIGSSRDNATTVMAVDGSNMFTSTLQLSPLSNSDAGQYTCSVVLTSVGESTFIAPSAASNDSKSLNVSGKHYCSYIPSACSPHSLIVTGYGLQYSYNYAYNFGGGCIITIFLHSALIDYLSHNQ